MRTNRLCGFRRRIGKRAITDESQADEQSQGFVRGFDMPEQAIDLPRQPVKSLDHSCLYGCQRPSELRLSAFGVWSATVATADIGRLADALRLVRAAARNVQDVVIWVAKPDHAQRAFGMNTADHGVIAIRIFVEPNALGMQVRRDLFDFVTN